MAAEPGRDRLNILLLVTDQQRSVDFLPSGWADAHLPSVARLARHGLTFRNAFNNTCMCSPSRATLFTGLFPAQHGVTVTFGPRGAPNATMLSPSTKNLARILGEAGYRVAYKGKWHLSLPAFGDEWAPADIDHLAEGYGFTEWNPPDAGNSLSEPATLGGGTAMNDARYVNRTGADPGFGESAEDFLRAVSPGDDPFCLVVSLVNPHDLWVSPYRYGDETYRRGAGADLGIPVPANWDEDLSAKPTVQGLFRARYDGGPLGRESDRLDYVNFYGYLQSLVDRHICQLLDTLDECGLTEDTLIVRLSDHGEMGLAHGLREKAYNAYEETMRVGLTFSNPRWFDGPATTDALAGLVDIVPTLASLAGAAEHPELPGVDLTPVLRDTAGGVQDSIHFTYDDGLGDIGAVPGRIRCIRTAEWKYAVYYDEAGSSFEHELYHLASDPAEMRNLATGEPRPEQIDLHELLTAQMARLGTTPTGFGWPAVLA